MKAEVKEIPTPPNFVFNIRQVALSVAYPKNISKLTLNLLRQPEIATSLISSDWNATLRVLRSEGVLARLQAQLARRNLLPLLPKKVQDQMLAARVIADDHERMLNWEVDRIHYALRHTEITFVLLKGAAYVAAGLPPSHGRLVSDVDILVTESNLQIVESALLDAGWESVKKNEYDQYYFRQWMHEIPPLRHMLRQTDIDVHHAILPKTAKLKPDPQRLLASAKTIAGSDIRVLSDIDMVLHSATHLFFGGDLDHGLRDLLDLHDLLSHFSSKDGFWDELVPRACELDLSRPLFYALRYCQKYLNTPIPNEVIQQSSVGKPRIIITYIMDILVDAVMSPRIPEHRTVSIGFHRWLLYIRSHYVRMPMRLLIPHLMRKAVRRAQSEDEI